MSLVVTYDKLGTTLSWIKSRGHFHAKNCVLSYIQQPKPLYPSRTHFRGPVDPTAFYIAGGNHPVGFANRSAQGAIWDKMFTWVLWHRYTNRYCQTLFRNSESGYWRWCRCSCQRNYSACCIQQWASSLPSHLTSVAAPIFWHWTHFIHAWHV